MCDCDEGKPNVQGQKANRTSLSEAELGLKVAVPVETTGRRDVCAREKWSEMTGHEAGKDMKHKKERKCAWRGKDEGNQMEGLETNEARPH